MPLDRSPAVARPSGRSRPVVALAVVMLVAVACGSPVPAGSPSPTLAPPSAGQVFPTASDAPSQTATVIDRNLQATIAVPKAPEAAVAGFGSIWVPSHRGSAIYRIDPSTNETTKIELSTWRTNNVVVIGAGSVWLGVWPRLDKPMEWLRIDPHTNRVMAHIPALGRGAFGGGRLWTYEDVLAEIDPESNRVIRSVTLTSRDDETSVTYADGSVWVGTAHGLFRVNPKTLETITRIDVVAWKVVSDGEQVWTIDEGTGSVAKIDTTRNEVASTVQTKAAAFGRIVANTLLIHGSPLLTVVDIPTASVVGEFELGKYDGGGYPEIAFDSLWIPNFYGDSVYRIAWPLQ